MFDNVKTYRSNSWYSEHGDEFLDGRRTTKPNDGLANRKIRAEDSDNGTGYTENDGDVDLRGEDNRKSRNTQLNHDEKFDDAFAGISVITPYSSPLSVGAGKGFFI